MQCERCHTEMSIQSTRLEAEGDKSPDTETVVWRVLEYACRSRQCPEYGKVQKTEKVRLQG